MDARDQPHDTVEVSKRNGVRLQMKHVGRLAGGVGARGALLAGFVVLVAVSLRLRQAGADAFRRATPAPTPTVA